MADYCDDNRFELINKYKQELINGTNIETASDEMAVIDDILFRFWQMGWLDKLEQPEQRWIPVFERPSEGGIRVQIQLANGWIITGFYDDGYWYSVPDCGDALNGDAIQMDVLAWMPLPPVY